MPREIMSKEEFQKLLPSATEIRVVRRAGDSTKIKLRTADQLYTYKAKEGEVEALTKGSKTPARRVLDEYQQEQSPQAQRHRDRKPRKQLRLREQV